MSTAERVVIDTNVFITIFKKDSENRWMFDKILNGEWILC
jgi:predicted nucleic acid-binding protein